MKTTTKTTWYAWINCGNATPTMQAAETADHETTGYRNATRRGEGATEAEALEALRQDCEAWDQIDA